VFGVTLVLSIFALIIFATYIFYTDIFDNNQNITSNAVNQNITSGSDISQSNLSSTITGITIMIGLLIVILLLPSIRRFKVGYIELEPVHIDTKVRQHMEAVISKVKFGMQSF
jgi:hypothetical protein